MRKCSITWHDSLELNGKYLLCGLCQECKLPSFCLQFAIFCTLLKSFDLSLLAFATIIPVKEMISHFLARNSEENILISFFEPLSPSFYLDHYWLTYKLIKTFRISSINELSLKDIYTFHSFAKRGGDELPITCNYFNETMTYRKLRTLRGKIIVEWHLYNCFL